MFLEWWWWGELESGVVGPTVWVCKYCVESCGGVVLGSYYGGGDISLWFYGVGDGVGVGRGVVYGFVCMESGGDDVVLKLCGAEELIF